MIRENIRLALASLRMNKLRSLLTMLGIIIGIMSITSIVFIGNAMTSSVSDDMSSFGSRNISVAVQKRDSEMEFFDEGISLDSGDQGLKPLSEDLISDEIVEDLRSRFSDRIDGISIIERKGQDGAQAREGDAYANVSINAVNKDYIKSTSLKLLEGNFIEDIDLKNRSNAAVVSDVFVKNIFGDQKNLLGREIKIYTKDAIEVYEIAGIYQYDNQGMPGMGPSKDLVTDMFIALTTAKENSLEKNYAAITVIGRDEKDIKNLTKSLESYFNSLYRNNPDWKAFVMNMSSMLDMVTSSLKKISLAITFIAGISLLVGGIGVMNIMLVSVTERTREIGTKKALGAREKHIKMQFVIEAMIISFIGGAIGLILGTAIGALISKLFKVSFIFSPWLAINSIVFSTLIGVFFGYYPAKKAAKLNPIDALRYE